MYTIRIEYNQNIYCEFHNPQKARGTLIDYAWMLKAGENSQNYRDWIFMKNGTKATIIEIEKPLSLQEFLDTYGRR